MRRLFLGWPVQKNHFHCIAFTIGRVGVANDVADAFENRRLIMNNTCCEIVQSGVAQISWCRAISWRGAHWNGKSQIIKTPVGMQPESTVQNGWSHLHNVACHTLLWWSYNLRKRFERPAMV